MSQNKLYEMPCPIIYTILENVQGSNIMNFKDGWERECGKESIETLQKNSLAMWKFINSTQQDTLYILMLSNLCCKTLTVFQMLIVTNIYIGINIGSF